MMHAIGGFHYLWMSAFHPWMAEISMDGRDFWMAEISMDGRDLYGWQDSTDGMQHTC